jgi:hypothetical protein
MQHFAHDNDCCCFALIQKIDRVNDLFSESTSRLHGFSLSLYSSLLSCLQCMLLCISLCASAAAASAHDIDGNNNQSEGIGIKDHV